MKKTDGRNLHAGSKRSPSYHLVSSVQLFSNYTVSLTHDIGCALTCWALLGATRSIRRGDHATTNRMFRARIYAQGFTLLCLVAGSYYYAEDRDKRKVFEGVKAEQRAREKNEKWIRELEARDREDREERESRIRRLEGRLKSTQEGKGDTSSGKTDTSPGKGDTSLGRGDTSLGKGDSSLESVKSVLEKSEEWRRSSVLAAVKELVSK